jgi:hypothetical protein
MVRPDQPPPTTTTRWPLAAGKLTCLDTTDVRAAELMVAPTASLMGSPTEAIPAAESLPKSRRVNFFTSHPKAILITSLYTSILSLKAHKKAQSLHYTIYIYNKNSWGCPK